jgi:hypothetical protein
MSWGDRLIIVPSCAQPKKIMQLLRLRQINNAVFVRVGGKFHKGGMGNAQCSLPWGPWGLTEEN